MGTGRALERLVRQLKIPKALAFVTSLFQEPSSFAIIAEIRGVLGLFRSLYLLELKIKNFGYLPSRWPVWSVRELVSKTN